MCRRRKKQDHREPLSRDTDVGPWSKLSAAVNSCHWVHCNWNGTEVTEQCTTINLDLIVALLRHVLLLSQMLFVVLFFLLVLCLLCRCGGSL